MVAWAAVSFSPSSPFCPICPLLLSTSAARLDKEQQRNGEGSDFGALIGRLGKFGEAQLRNQARVPFYDMEAQSHISA